MQRVIGAGLVGACLALTGCASNSYCLGEQDYMFGPRFAFGLIACGVSFIFGVTGVGALFFAQRLQIPKMWVAVATCVAGAPFVYLISLIILGKAGRTDLTNRCSRRLAGLFPRLHMIKILQETAGRASARRG